MIQNELKAVQDKMKQLQTFDSSLFIDHTDRKGISRVVK